MKIGCDLFYAMTKYCMENEIFEDECGGNDLIDLYVELVDELRENNIKTCENEFILEIKKRRC